MGKSKLPEKKNRNYIQLGNKYSNLLRKSIEIFKNIITFLLDSSSCVNPIKQRRPTVFLRSPHLEAYLKVNLGHMMNAFVCVTNLVFF